MPYGRHDTSEIIIKSHRRARACHSIFPRHSSLLRCNLVSARRREKVTRSLVREDRHIFRVSLVTHSLHPSFKRAAWTGLTRSQRRAELVHYVRFVRATSPLVPETRLFARVEQESRSMKRVLVCPTSSFSSSLKSRWNLEEILSSHAITTSTGRRILAEPSNQNFRRNFSQ